MPHSPSQTEVSNFIESTFVSVWALELLLFLKRDPHRKWQRAELVAGLRASDSVVERGIDSLLAAGLIASEENQSTRYCPASEGVGALVDAAEQLYARKPDGVRRMIILSRNDTLSAFADAFRLRKD